jgi:hypothetical protein
VNPELSYFVKFKYEQRFVGIPQLHTKGLLGNRGIEIQKPGLTIGAVSQLIVQDPKP